MQLQDLQPKFKRKNRKRVGRGGKRGTYSGKGMKGQKSRSGKGARPDFRGGNPPVWKLFPKQRGASKKADNKYPHRKHRFFSLKNKKPTVLNLERINKLFNDGEVISPETLVKKGILKSPKESVKILGGGKTIKKVKFENIKLSKSAKEKTKTP